MNSLELNIALVLFKGDKYNMGTDLGLHILFIYLYISICNMYK